jgi:hypothetical protein
MIAFSQFLARASLLSSGSSSQLWQRDASKERLECGIAFQVGGQPDRVPIARDEYMVRPPSPAPGTEISCRDVMAQDAPRWPQELRDFDGVVQKDYATTVKRDNQR